MYKKRLVLQGYQYPVLTSYLSQVVTVWLSFDVKGTFWITFDQVTNHPLANHFPKIGQGQGYMEEALV